MAKTTQRSRVVTGWAGAVVALALALAIGGATGRAAAPSATYALYLPAVAHDAPMAVPAPRKPQLAGQLRGEIEAVAVRGATAYVGDAGRLAVLDVTDPMAVRRLGERAVATDVSDVVVAGLYAYAATDEGLAIIDVATSADPRVVGTYRTAGRAQRVVVSGTTAYLTSVRVDRNPGTVFYHTLHVVDVSNPSAPRLISEVEAPGARDVEVQGNLAYVTTYAGLLILDVTERAVPRRVGLAPTGEGYAVTVVGTTAYVAAGLGGLVVVNVANPVTPLIVGAATGAAPALDVAVAGGYAYVVQRHETLGEPPPGVAVVDVSSGAAPRVVGFFATPGLAQRVTVAAGRAYVVDSDLWMLDLATPAAPRELGLYGVAARGTGLAVVGQTVYVAAGLQGLRRVDASASGAPRVAAVAGDVGAADVAVAGRHAYVVGPGGLTVLDLAQPTGLRRVGQVVARLGLPGVAERIVVDGGYAYIAVVQAVLVVEVVNPAAPRLVMTYPVAGWPHGLAVVGEQLFIAEGPAPAVGGGGEAQGLRVLDIRNPSAPRPVSFFAMAGEPRDVTVNAGLAYVAATSRWNAGCGCAEGGGVTVVDVSNPAAPRLHGTFPLDMATAVAVAGDYAYVGGQIDLQIFDIRDTAHPLRVALYDGAGYAERVQVSLGYGYVLTTDGLLVVRAME